MPTKPLRHLSPPSELNKGDDWNSYIPLEGIEREDVEAFLPLYGEHHEISPVAHWVRSQLRG